MEKRIFSDVTIPSYFEAANKHFKITPQKNHSTGQVEFIVEGNGSEIDAALNELYQDAKVGALSYIRAQKGLRSSIFALKGGAR